MLAYKFRSISQLAYALDIILVRRLYCANWCDLNDPMEGYFTYHVSNKAWAQRIFPAKARYKVCSLSLDATSPLLWAHYAGAFDGLAVEVNVESDADNVSYKASFPQLDAALKNKPTQFINTVLRSKLKVWEHEKEVRIIRRDQWYYLKKPVSRVIIGHKVNCVTLNALHILCTERNIKLSRTVVKSGKIHCEPLIGRPNC